MCGLLSVGGNDLLRGLAADRGAGLRGFEAALDRFLHALPLRPVLHEKGLRFDLKGTRTTSAWPYVAMHG